MNVRASAITVFCVASFLFVTPIFAGECPKGDSSQEKKTYFGSETEDGPAWIITEYHGEDAKVFIQLMHKLHPSTTAKNGDAVLTAISPDGISGRVFLFKEGCIPKEDVLGGLGGTGLFVLNIQTHFEAAKKNKSGPVAQ